MRALKLSSESTFVYAKLAVAYAYRGQTYADLKDYRQALQGFDRALELDPNNIWREDVYRQLKKPKWMCVQGCDDDVSLLNNSGPGQDS
jgi:tetratricopeptide (TPR) repeat protein